MSARWMTLGVWALVAAAAVAWGFKVFVRPAPVPTGAAVADATPVLQADLTRLLGTDPPPPAAVPEAAPPPPDARFTLLGVMAPRTATGAARSTREGVALIAVDDRPPRAFRVGARVDGETVLQAVSARGAELGLRGGPVQVALELPPLPPPATGTLSGATPAAGLPPMAGARPPVPVPPFARPGLQRPLPPQPPVSQPGALEDGAGDAPEVPPHQQVPRKPNPTLM